MKYLPIFPLTKEQRAADKPSTGHISLVGVGPGDADDQVEAHLAVLMQKSRAFELAVAF